MARPPMAGLNGRKVTGFTPAPALALALPDPRHRGGEADLAPAVSPHPAGRVGVPAAGLDGFPIPTAGGRVLGPRADTGA